MAQLPLNRARPVQTEILPERGCNRRHRLALYHPDGGTQSNVVQRPKNPNRSFIHHNPAMFPEVSPCVHLSDPRREERSFSSLGNNVLFAPHCTIAYSQMSIPFPLSLCVTLKEPNSNPYQTQRPGTDDFHYSSAVASPSSRSVRRFSFTDQHPIPYEPVRLLHNLRRLQNFLWSTAVVNQSVSPARDSGHN